MTNLEKCAQNEKVNLEKRARREQILSVGLSIIAKSGWGYLTIPYVAAQAGISTRTVQRFFTGRKQLASAIVTFAKSKGYKEIAKSGKELGY